MKNIRDEKAIKAFGERVKSLRKKLKISQDTLAFSANIPRMQVSRIERGEFDVGLSTIVALAEALDVRTKDLFD